MRKEKDDYRVEDCGYDTPCWIWQKWCNKQGYGSKWYDGRTQRAHRVYYQMERGSIPKDHHLDHLCRNRNCVNPDHLEPVSHIENHRRRPTKFTLKKAEELRALRNNMSQEKLAKRFGISRRFVRDILEGRHWNGSTWEQEGSIGRTRELCS